MKNVLNSRLIVRLMGLERLLCGLGDLRYFENN